LEKVTSIWKPKPSPQFHATQFYRKKVAPPLSILGIFILIAGSWIFYDNVQPKLTGGILGVSVPASQTLVKL
jgi:hypothetical protein